MFLSRVVAFSAMISFLLTAFHFEVKALSDGYILCGAYSGKTTVLIDKNGDVVHTWDHSMLPDSLNGYSCYLLENGDLLRSAQAPMKVRVNMTAAPRQGVIDRIDPEGNVVWTYMLANDTFMLHHDMKPMANGNILAVTFMTEPKARMLAAGVDTTCLKTMMGMSQLISAEKIIEIKPKQPSGGDIVWEWKMIDHVVRGDSAAAHPELFSGTISQTYYYGQWVHLNGIDIDPQTDLIVFSSRIFSECYVIDHGTTTQQAAGHTGGKRGKGGDLLYRWGKPANYQTNGGYVIDVLHCPTWIPEGYSGAGHILFFNNNIDALHSQAVEILPPHDDNWNFQRTAGAAFGPEQPTWVYAPADSFYCAYMSSALRMPNGNTLVHEAYPPDSGGVTSGGAPKTNSRLREVTKAGQVVWEYLIKLQSETTGMAKAFNPAKIMYYPSSYAGITNLFTRRETALHGNVSSKRLVSQKMIFQMKGCIYFSEVAGCTIELYSAQGQKSLSISPKGRQYYFNTKTLPVGIYYARVTIKNHEKASRMITLLP